MPSPQVHQPRPAPLAPPQPALRLLNRWRDVWRALGPVRPAGSLWPWYDANRAEQAGRTRVYERTVETLVNANRAAALTPQAGPVREATEAWLSEIAAQCQAVNPADTAAPPLAVALSRAMRESADVQCAALAAMADGQYSATEYDDIEREARQAMAELAFVAERARCERAKLIRGAA